MRTYLLSLLLLCAPVFAGAQSAAPVADTSNPTAASDSGDGTEKVAPGDDLKPSQKTERGWFFFEKNKKPPEDAETPKQPLPAQTPPPEQKKPPEDKCKKADSWSADCGFVDPGTDFEFQAKQRDALLLNMTMSKNDPKAVEQFQYYIRWVLGRATEVANLWAYNAVQNPELDPAATQPISQFGIRMMTDVQKGKEDEIWKVIKDEGGFLVFFTKSDCDFCHAMVPSMLRISQTTGIPVRNAAIDDKCIPAFADGCLSGDAVQAPAQALQVTTVPSVFLYAKPDTWIRVSTGISDEITIRSRMFSFFTAYRNAMLKGVNNAQKGRPSVDFSGQDEITGNAAGVTVDKSQEPRQPTEAEVSQLLGKH